MFNSMKVGSRLALGFSLLLVFMVAIIVIGIAAIKKVNAELETIVQVQNVRTQLANDMIDKARETAIAVRNILLIKFKSESSESIQEHRDHIAILRKSYAESFAKKA